VLIAIGRRHQNPDVPSEEFVLGITEHAFRRPIDLDDQSLRVNRDDRIRRRIQDGPQSFFTVAHFTVGLPAVRDISHDRQDLSAGTRLVVQERMELMHPDFGTVLLEEAALHFKSW
jgi:hypothetical protein